ncbi:MAG: response regulator [Deltaproteobacteria bacterium]|nr:response regulator [Deltaproteobacteria bacterium]
MKPSRILVVDDDAWILRMVTTVLAKRGHEVVTACDGDDALERLKELRPDLIITDVMMPKLDGWSFVKQVRTRPELAFVPVVFLTALGSDEDRIKGFRLGADDYLPKPFRFEELDLRVTNALKRRHQIESTARAQIQAEEITRGPGFHGTIDQLGLSSVLTLLEMERKSGVLVLSRPSSSEIGRLFIRDGRVASARYDGKASPTNEQVVYELLGWSEGRFEFSSLEVEMEDEIRLSTTHLLMEGARRIDESQRVRTRR